jgi:hypothetical protein
MNTMKEFWENVKGKGDLYYVGCAQAAFFGFIALLLSLVYVVIKFR